jgi:hypothetical protein
MLETLIEVTELFKDNHIDYCLIGGLAIMLYHGRANTVDMDFYVLVNDLAKVKEVFEKNSYAVRDAGEYQLKTKVKGTPIDILFADSYIGEDVVKRATQKPLGKHFVRVATPEDLIVLKTIADRTVDRRDIEELREIFGKSLDEAYIQKKLKYIEKLLKEP